MSNVRIVMNRHGLGEVFMDGVKIPCLKKFTLTCEAGKVNTLVLEQFSQEVEFQGQVAVTCMDSSEYEWDVNKVIGKVVRNNHEHEVGRNEQSRHIRRGCTPTGCKAG